MTKYFFLYFPFKNQKRLYITFTYAVLFLDCTRVSVHDPTRNVFFLSLVLNCSGRFDFEIFCLFVWMSFFVVVVVFILFYCKQRQDTRYRTIHCLQKGKTSAFCTFQKLIEKQRNNIGSKSWRILDMAWV